MRKTPSTVITQHQYIVLATLYKGGHARRYEEGEHYLTDVDGNVMFTRADTLAKLTRMGFIREEYDKPALGVTQWTITQIGRNWIKEHYATKTMIQEKPDDYARNYMY